MSASSPQPPRIAREAEPRRVADRYYSLIDQVGERVRPDDPGLTGWLDTYRRTHHRRLAVDLHLIERFVPPGSQIAEYGAVPLLTTGALAALGYRVHGLDVAPERFATAISELGLDVQRCDVEAEPVPLPDGSCEAVIFHELLEHLRINPLETLREVHRVLAAGGRLLLSTPNLRSLRGVRNLVLRNQGHAVSAGIYEQYEKLETLGHMGHVREYTTREVCDLLTRLGFRAERLIFRGGHGRGVVGLVEQLAPSLRPFFSLVAVKAEEPPPGAADAEATE